MLEVFAGLSAQSRNLRFPGAKPRLNERDLDLLVDVGSAGREAVVAVEQDTGCSIGIGRYVRDADAPEAESIDRSNWPALALIRGLGDVLTTRAEGSVVELSSASRTENVRVRIIAGSKRGARIAAPKGLATRPTGDRVRESAFNLIGPVEGAAVLDLFAGSGAFGLEALSRGAATATFVESDRAACRTIAENLEKLRLTGARVACADAVWTLRQESRLYDLVLVDPPYEQWGDLEGRLGEHLPRVLAPDGLLVVETAARTEPSLPLALRTSRRYGSARLSLFEHHS